jgi:hypothetical protein
MGPGSPNTPPPNSERRKALVDALMGVPGRIGDAFGNMAAQGLAANERFIQGDGSERQFLPSTEDGGRIGALASFLMSNAGAAGVRAAPPPRGLPMDTASRMARAREMGFTQDAYHASPSFRADRLTEFRPGREGGSFFYHNPADTNAFGEAYFQPFETARRTGGGYAVVPAMVNPGRQTVLDFTEIAPDMVWTSQATKPLTERIKGAKADGYDSVILRNIIEPDTGVGADQLIMLSPENIRSRFAAFDPAKRNSADLLAGYGPNPLAAALSAQPQER